MKIANRDARKYVQSLWEFEGSNLFAVIRQPSPDSPASWYVVYSYGYHWPLFVRYNGVWYENTDKYSRTTSRHHSQCHPLGSTTLLSLDQIKTLADGGFQALAKQRVAA